MRGASCTRQGERSTARVDSGDLPVSVPAPDPFRAGEGGPLGAG
jgi:hypothetical protein